MTNTFASQLNPQKIKDYETKDLAYKNQAHKIVCANLGYEPPLNISILSELNIRSALRRYSQGEISDEPLQEYIDFQITFINKLMLEKASSFNC